MTNKKIFSLIASLTLVLVVARYSTTGDDNLASDNVELTL